MSRTKRIFSIKSGTRAIALVGALMATPIFAAGPKVEEAIKSLAKIEADAGKFQAFCKIMKDLGDVPETEVAKADALEVQLGDLLKSIGPDVVQAWDLGSDLDAQSADGKAFEAAVDAIEARCPD
jgi:hypothetical protein